MKLAEALIERKGMLQKIGNLENRLLGAGLFQEGTEPAEDAAKLLRELEGAYAAYQGLITRINRTNTLAYIGAEGIQLAPATTAEGVLLADLIVQRDVLIRRQNSLRRLAETVRNGLGITRRTQSEIRMVTRLDLEAIEHQIAQLGEAARKLDAQIQGANWNIDLM